jgi:hypothetical protein
VIEMEKTESQFLATPEKYHWNASESEHQNIIFKTVKKYVPKKVWDEMLHYSAPTDGPAIDEPITADSSNLDESSVFMGPVTAQELDAHARAIVPFFSSAGEASGGATGKKEMSIEQQEEEAEQDERVAQKSHIPKDDLNMADLRDRRESEFREALRQEDIKTQTSVQRQAEQYREMDDLVAADEMLRANGGIQSAKKAAAKAHPDRIPGFYQLPPAEQLRLNREFVEKNRLRTLAEKFRRNPLDLFDKIEGKTDEAARARERAAKEREWKASRERARADEEEMAKENMEREKMAEEARAKRREMVREKAQQEAEAESAKHGE